MIEYIENSGDYSMFSPEFSKGQLLNESNSINIIVHIKRNIETEIGMLKEISSFFNLIETSIYENEKKVLMGAINSLGAAIKTINQAIPEMTKEIKIVNILPVERNISEKKEMLKKSQFSEVSFQRAESPALRVVLRNKDKERFLKELSISESFIKKVKRRKKEKREKYTEFKGARGYLKIANKFFLKTASEAVKKGKYKSISVGIRKANFDMLLESYISMMYFTTFIIFLISLFLTVIFIFVNLGLESPFFSLYTGNYFRRILNIFWIPIAAPIFTFLIIYYYPGTEQKSIERRINDELPFAVIHMSAISGSGIEPSQIFKIIGMSKDYPALSHEIRKILNQINLYGYDLVTSLNHSAKTSPSERLAELFSGISTTVTSGARLEDFLEKRAESLLLTYRMEREQYSKLVEAILDIYISVVIAAPMIFLLLVTMMSLTNIGLKISSNEISVIGVLSIAVLNVIFMIIIQLKQPTY